ncbi:kinase-like domain-containing protein [Coniella lustricola]|uniref:Kinase-like domain-containing protein n=1 Tax=Coniella lustricola TaxID=2025994 RepID=A0A2T3AE86_9PEZI|nr:kinase-like domain-containing protein [Coniella lustricola]
MEASLQSPPTLRASRSSPGPVPSSQGSGSGVTDQDAFASHGLQSPGIKVEFHGGQGGASEERPLHGLPVAAIRPAMSTLPESAPAVPQFQSPLRQHRRTPSQHREVKETLNARSEYTNDDLDGSSHHVINQYTVKEEIGRGSYGAVHLALDQFGNEYAVKEFSKTRLRKRAQSNILRRGPRRPGARQPFRPGLEHGIGAESAVSHQLSDQKAQESKDALFLIREEIAIMKKLNHPNLVSLIEVLDDPEEDSLYMVLEMCKKGVIMKVGLGESAKPYDEEECRCWFRDLILGIEYLHAQGVVHRDIKPDNLLLTEDDVLKIVDFGVSEMFEKPANMRTAKSAGSPAFLPPELCVAKHGDVSGTAADIWSMGVSLYCLRYGRIPFNEPGILDMYEAIKSSTPQYPEDENPVFLDLMGKLMAKDPEERITMPEIRDHPWVTKDGADPLLSTEENCSDPVQPPNELEVSHAFTRRMSHLLCVMRAISNFKALLHSRSRVNSPRQKLSPSDALTPTEPAHRRPYFRHHPKPSMDEQELAEMKRSNEEHAARLLKERMHVQKTRGGNAASCDEKAHRGSVQVKQIANAGASEEGIVAPPEPFERKDGSRGSDSDTGSRDRNAPPRLQHTPPVLGIGAGGQGHDPTASHSQPASSVADSPTAVDFDVYDRAYAEEVERIRRSGGRPSLYTTRHLRQNFGVRDEQD